MNVALACNPDPVARAMSALPEGFYWIRLGDIGGRVDGVAWEPAELKDGEFWVCGNDVPMRPSNVAEIGEKVAAYKPNANPPAERGDFWVRRTRESAWTLASFVAGLWYHPGADFGQPPTSVAMVGPRLVKPAGDY